MDIENFIEHPKSKDESSIWRFFLTNKDLNKGRCIKCMRIIKAEGKSTSALHSHMNNIHKINTLKRHIDVVSTSLSSTKSTKFTTSTPKMKITHFYENAGSESLEQVIARMAALDGIPFQLFCTSEDIRKGLVARGFRDIPKSPNTIRKYVLSYADEIRNKTIALFKQLKSEGNKFSITSDEWTSLRNRRFINVNVHSSNETWNLGLGRAYGKLPAEKIVKLIETRLNDFHMKPESDIVNLTTDGPKVMIKVGKLFLALCIVHGLQLAVVEVLYKTQPKQASEENLDEAVLDIISDIFEEDDESHSFIVENDDMVEPNELTDDFNIFQLIKKIRSVVIAFRRSPTKNDEILQKYVVDEFGDDFSLILDCKTRWSSLLSMVERFDKLKTCVMKALIDVKSKVTFSDEEVEMIRTLIEILLPVKLAVEALCREDATLLTANTTLQFLLANIGSGTVLHDRMKEALKRRISERLTDLSNVVQYLHNGAYVDQSLGLRKLSKDHLVKTIIKFTNSQDIETISPEIDVNEEDVSDTPAAYGPLTLKEQLEQVLDDAATGFQKKSFLKRDFQKVVKREIAVFEDGGGRGPNLEAVYQFFLTIKPTSVDAERAFSNAGLLCTKVRSRLSDESIDALAFLRFYFQKVRAKNQPKKKLPIKV